MALSKTLRNNLIFSAFNAAVRNPIVRENETLCMYDACEAINEATALADGWDWKLARNGYLAGKSNAYIFAAVQVSMPPLGVNFWRF
jgi:hypothetical protein